MREREDLDQLLSVKEECCIERHNKFCVCLALINIFNRTQEGRDDDALTDFKAAADEGSGFAKSMMVEMNPYAAMCNAMLKNVFTAMSEGKDTNQVMEKNLKNNTG